MHRSRFAGFILDEKLIRFCEKSEISHVCRHATVAAIRTPNSTPRRIEKNERVEIQKNLKPFSEIPGPKSFPFIGSSMAILYHPQHNPEEYHKFWDTMISQYGPILKIKPPMLATIVCTTNPEDVETFMKTTLHEPKRVFFGALKKARDLQPGNFFNGKTGLLTENGDEWWRLRSQVQSHLLKPKSISRFISVIDEASQQFIDRIELLKNVDDTVRGNFLQELYRWSLECVGWIALNRSLGCLEKKDEKCLVLVQQITDLFETLPRAEMGLHIWKFIPNEAFNRLQIAQNDYFRSIDREITATSKCPFSKSKKSHRSMMEILEEDANLNDGDVKTMLMDMFLAGMDTTSHATAFALYLLARNPQYQKVLQTEVDEVVGTNSKITETHLSQMNFVKQVLKETLRLYPLTLRTGRVLPRNITMSGYQIPAGTVAYSLNMQIGRSENNFLHADKFLPERWGRNRPFGEIHPFSSLPFSHGKRVCVGKRIAEQQIHIFLTKIMQKYNVILENPEEMKIRSQVVVKPDIPLPFTFSRRRIST